MPCIHVSRFSGDGVKSNSDASPPSLSPGVAMAAPCDIWGGPDDDNDDDNNFSSFWPGIVTGCAAMFPSECAPMFGWFPGVALMESNRINLMLGYDEF